MSKSIGLLFDYNGVIADDEPLHQAAFANVLSAYGISLSHEMYKQFCFGRTDREGFEQLRSQFTQKLCIQFLDALVKQKQKEYQKLLSQQNILYSGAIDVIVDLRDYAKLGIVTSSTRAELIATLDNNGITKEFDVLITAENIVRGKPDAEGYLKGVQGLGLPSNRVIAVEDSRLGVQAAKSAGIKCIAVLQTSTAEDLVLADVTVAAITNVDRSLVKRLLNLH